MIEVVEHALMITGFVFVMMLVIDYLNVLASNARWTRLVRRRWEQYIVASALGAIPGCLGAFAIVAMYLHGAVTLGAVVAAMVTTSGDASFMMLAMIPKQAFLVIGVLSVLGIASGAATDTIVGWRRTRESASADGFEIHTEEPCECFPRGQVLRQWKECSAARGILAVGLTAFVVALVTGQAGPTTWGWMRLTLILISAAGLFIVSTVPDHFLEEHLWRHIAREHVPRVFLWTLGALIVMHVLSKELHIEDAIRESKYVVLLIACLVGLIPDSGPHLLFVTLYSRGTIPLSILLANSIVQDGHGMLPMLAHSRRAFLGIKAINFVVGVLAGAVAMALGL